MIKDLGREQPRMIISFMLGLIRIIIVFCGIGDRIRVQIFLRHGTFRSCIQRIRQITQVTRISFFDKVLHIDGSHFLRQNNLTAGFEDFLFSFLILPRNQTHGFINDITQFRSMRRIDQRHIPAIPVFHQIQSSGIITATTICHVADIGSLAVDGMGRIHRKIKRQISIPDISFKVQFIAVGLKRILCNVGYTVSGALPMYPFQCGIISERIGSDRTDIFAKYHILKQRVVRKCVFPDRLYGIAHLNGL